VKEMGVAKGPPPFIASHLLNPVARNSFPVCLFICQFTLWNGVLITNESTIGKTYLNYPHPSPYLSLPRPGLLLIGRDRGKREEGSNIPPLHGEECNDIPLP